MLASIIKYSRWVMCVALSFGRKDRNERNLQDSNDKNSMQQSRSNKETSEEVENKTIEINGNFFPLLYSFFAGFKMKKKNEYLTQKQLKCRIWAYSLFCNCKCFSSGKHSPKSLQCLGIFPFRIFMHWRSSPRNQYLEMCYCIVKWAKNSSFHSCI